MSSGEQHDLATRLLKERLERLELWVARQRLALGSGDVSGGLPGDLTVVGLGGIPVDVSGIADGYIITYVAANADFEVLPAASALGTVQAHGNLGATETIDVTGNVSYHWGTLNADVVLTFTGATSGVDTGLTLELIEDGTGGWGITWPGSVVWLGGTEPTHDTTAGTTTIYGFITRDGGTTWVGGILGGSGVTYATPAIILGTAAAGGAAATTIRSDSTIAAFDATVPTTQAFGDAAATGSVAFAARRDHLHGMPAVPAGSTDHEHIIDVFSGDGSVAAFEISEEPIDPEAVFAFVGGSWTAVTVSGGMNTTVTFGSPPGSGTNNVVIQYPAVAA